MEEAEIQPDVNSGSDGNDGGLYQQGQFPSVINTDDLVFELGKEMVDKLNKEKLLNNLLKKSKASEEEAINAKKESEEMSKKIEPLFKKIEELQSSNKTYEEKNRNMGNDLSKVRQELKISDEKLNQQITANTELTKQESIEKKNADDLSEHKKEIEQKNKELEELRAMNADLSAKNDALSEEMSLIEKELESSKTPAEENTKTKKSTTKKKAKEASTVKE